MSLSCSVSSKEYAEPRMTEAALTTSKPWKRETWWSGDVSMFWPSESGRCTLCASHRQSAWKTFHTLKTCHSLWATADWESFDNEPKYLSWLCKRYLETKTAVGKNTRSEPASEKWCRMPGRKSQQTLISSWPQICHAVIAAICLRLVMHLQLFSCIKATT